MKKYWKILLCVALVMMVTCLCSFSAVAASADTGVAGDVAGAVENTWNDAQGQIKQVVNNL